VTLAFGLAGWGTALLCRLLAAMSIDHLDRAAWTSHELMAQADRAVSALGRIVEVLERRAEPRGSRDPNEIGRAELLAEIERTTRSQRWADTESLLNEFQAKFPDDPVLR